MRPLETENNEHHYNRTNSINLHGTHVTTELVNMVSYSLYTDDRDVETMIEFLQNTLRDRQEEREALKTERTRQFRLIKDAKTTV